MKNPAPPSSGDSCLIAALATPSSTEVINSAGEFYPNASFILINNNFMSLFYQMTTQFYFKPLTSSEMLPHAQGLAQLWNVC